MCAVDAVYERLGFRMQAEHLEYHAGEYEGAVNLLALWHSAQCVVERDCDVCFEYSLLLGDGCHDRFIVTLYLTGVHMRRH
jgi:hypothetical protein